MHRFRTFMHVFVAFFTIHTVENKLLIFWGGGGWVSAGPNVSNSNIFALNRLCIVSACLCIYFWRLCIDFWRMCTIIRWDISIQYSCHHFFRPSKMLTIFVIIIVRARIFSVSAELTRIHIVWNKLRHGRISHNRDLTGFFLTLS